VDHYQGSERRADRERAGSWTGSAETARCNLFLPFPDVPFPGLSAGRFEAALEGEPELARASLLEEGAFDREDLGQWHDHCSLARAVPLGPLGSSSTQYRPSEVPLPSRESEGAGEVGEEGAAGLVDAHCSDRARDLIAASGEEAGELARLATKWLPKWLA